MSTSTNPQPDIPTVDPAWALPAKPDMTSVLSGPAFARLIVAGREGGWPGIYRCWAEGRTTTEPTPTGTLRTRPARRRSLDKLLERRADLRAILSEAVEEKKTRLLSQLETVVEKAALGPPDRTTDMRADGSVARVREDSRNKNYAAMWLLERTDPEKYASRKRVEVDGQVSHDHRHAHLVASADQAGGYRVDPEAIEAALNADERLLLMGFLERIEHARLTLRCEDNQRALPGRSEENTNE